MEIHTSPNYKNAYQHCEGGYHIDQALGNNIYRTQLIVLRSTGTKLGSVF